MVWYVGAVGRYYRLVRLRKQTKQRQVSVSDHSPDPVASRVSHFEFVSDFEIRASDFILLVLVPSAQTPLAKAVSH